MSWESSQLEERVDRIVTLAATYPEAAGRVALRFIADEGRLASFSLVCESIGLEFARLIFDSLPDYAWKLLDGPIRVPVPLGKALEGFSRELLAECMEEPEATGSTPAENPFFFLKGLSKERLGVLFRGEPIERVALTGAYLKRGEIAEIARALEPEAAKHLIVTVSRLHRLPRAVAKDQARRFAEELETRVEPAEPVHETHAPVHETHAPVLEIHAPVLEIHAPVNPVDWAISEIDLERELEILTEAAGHSQELDEVIRSMPSSESIRAIVESARQKISG
jgi:hypothetical protein